MDLSADRFLFIPIKFERMYASYWRLTETPFTSRVDPRAYVETPAHEEALARLLYLIEQRRHCGVLLGERGSGKTMLLQTLARHLRRTQTSVISVDLLGLCGLEVARNIANQLGCPISDTASVPSIWRTLQDVLEGNCSADRSTIILLDHVERGGSDCQGILHRLIHSTMSLTGRVTVLMGLRNDHLGQFLTFLREVSELRIELGPLSVSETRQYVLRLVEGVGRHDQLFDPEIWDLLHQFSGGNPREIHRICDLALVAGMSEESNSVTRRHIELACDDLSTILWDNRRTGLVTTTKY